jgi:RNA-splicing ligase RtcB
MIYNSQMSKNKLRVVAHSCNPGRRILSSRPAQEKVAERPYLKKQQQKETKRARGIAQVAECLPSMYKSLDLIPSNIKTKQAHTKPSGSSLLIRKYN